MNTARMRVGGLLSRGSRGLILTTKADEVWIVESEDTPDDLVGSAVIVESTLAGTDRLRADWIGVARGRGLIA